MRCRQWSPLVLVLAAAACAGVQADQALVLEFQGEPRFDDAVTEYERIWAEEGVGITRTLQSTSGLIFAVDSISVEVMEGPSWAGSSTMGMRASYPPDTKRATLAHELGHIVIGDLVPDDAPAGTAPEPHYVLFLFLYDVWVELWGEDFADEQVVVESARRGLVDYEGIWQAVLALDADERARQLRAIIEEYSG